jgi:hypothetical protein
MVSKPFPIRVTEATVTLPDGTVKSLETLTNKERELLSHHIIKSTFQTMGMKVTFNKTAETSTG